MKKYVRLNKNITNPWGFIMFWKGFKYEVVDQFLKEYLIKAADGIERIISKDDVYPNEED